MLLFAILTKEDFDAAKSVVREYSEQAGKRLAFYVDGMYRGGRWMVNNPGPKPVYSGAIPRVWNGDCMVVWNGNGPYETARRTCYDSSLHPFCEYKK